MGPIDRTLSGATTQSQSGLEIDGNERVICTSKDPASDCLMSYQDTHWEEGGGVLYLHKDAVSIFYSPSQLG